MIAANLLGQDSNIASGAASNAVKNNRLLHTAEIQAIEKKAEELAKTKGGTKDNWVKKLSNEALIKVDEKFSKQLVSDPDALEALNEINGIGTGFTDKLGNQLKFLAKDDQFKNDSLFASSISANKAFYDVALKDYAPKGCRKSVWKDRWEG